jgi:hypothetical protein
VFAEFAAQAAGEADEPLGMLGQIALAHAGLAIEAVERGLRGDADQVPVALLVCGEYEQVIVIVALAGSAVVLVLARCRVRNPGWA